MNRAFASDCILPRPHFHALPNPTLASSASKFLPYVVLFFCMPVYPNLCSKCPSSSSATYAPYTFCNKKANRARGFVRFQGPAESQKEIRIQLYRMTQGQHGPGSISSPLKTKASFLISCLGDLIRSRTLPGSILSDQMGYALCQRTHPTWSLVG